jgi:hypothetical protein
VAGVDLSGLPIYDLVGPVCLSNGVGHIGCFPSVTSKSEAIRTCDCPPFRSSCRANDEWRDSESNRGRHAFRSADRRARFGHRELAYERHHRHARIELVAEV